MKIKNIIIVFIAFCCVGFYSCADLDLEPKGQFTEAEFFGTEAGVQTYFAGLYGWLPIEDFHYQQNNGYRPGDAWGTWESPKQQQATMSAEYVGDPQVNNNGNDYWRYDRIRDVNMFINNFEKYKHLYTEKKFNELLGEARFLRAFIFSGMVKRYGGIPIISEVQDPMADVETLRVSRNTEYECYKFIYEDLKFASENMTEKADKYRGTKWTALALQSRLMLYAATIAKYTQYVPFAGEEAYELGLAGIDASKANEFFQYSYDASKELIESGPYQLYNEYSDLAVNFHEMLLDTESKETIFFKNYLHHDLFNRNAYLIGHNWDALMLPNPSMSNFVGAQAYPSLTTMQAFEGFPDLVSEDGTPKRWVNPADIKNGMEPRMRGSMFFNGDAFQDVTFEIRRGLYKTFPWQASVVVDGLNNESPHNVSGNRILSNDYNTKYTFTAQEAANIHNINVKEEGGTYYINVIGAHGTRTSTGRENNCLTGAYVQKYINPKMEKGKIIEHASFQPWVVFRLGEVYLNHAEAAYELGFKEEANTYIRKIRERAGCTNLDISSDPADLIPWDYEKTATVYPIEIELQFIRDERYRELWGENHRWWDLRRWRVADKVLEQFRPRILSCYYVIDEDKYIYLDEREMGNRTWTANRICYYQSIPSGEINKNPNLLPQNPFR
ncbi:MAG: RagB/SusD family nutrient uptake outer membrane protein [Prolixibacteraceae bacterium]|nr:RagB/SusD family nutrient uptake outer membrane protein [Prolixibacteraceae bacterium]